MPGPDDTANYFKALEETPSLQGPFSSAASGTGISPDVQNMLDAPSPAEERRASDSNLQTLDALLSGASPPVDAQAWEDMINQRRKDSGLDPNYKAPEEWRPKSGGPGF